MVCSSIYLWLCNKLAYNFSDLKEQPFYYSSWFCGPGNWTGLSWIKCLLQTVSTEVTVVLFGYELFWKSKMASLTYLCLSRIVQKSRLSWDYGLRDPHVVPSAWQSQSSWTFKMAAQGSQRDCSKKQEVETGNLLRPGPTNGYSATSSIFYWLK